MLQAIVEKKASRVKYDEFTHFTKQHYSALPGAIQPFLLQATGILEMIVM